MRLTHTWLNDDRRDDETKFVDQPKLDELRGNIDAADQNAFAWLLFQFHDLVAKVSPDDSRFFIVDAFQRPREDDLVQ